MKLSEWIFLFLIIFSSFALISFYSIDRSSASGIAETQYANILTAACHDAAKTIPTETVESDSVWTKKEDREHTLNTLYKTIQYGFNTEYTSKGNEVTIYTPVVCLIDNDGYYISFNSAYDQYGNTYWANSASSYDAKMYSETITTSSLNSWTAGYGNFIVRYYLNDTVELTLPDGESIKDKRGKVYEKLKDYVNKGIVSEDALNELLIVAEDGGKKYNIIDLLKNKDDIFEKERNNQVIKLINEEVEFYVNHHNLWAEQLDVPYSFAMPEIAGEDWHRLLEHPTIISFMQGMQVRTQTRYFNIYALAGGEVTEEKQYFITSGDTYLDGKPVYTYHVIGGNCKDCNVEFVKDSTDITNKNTVEGKDITITDGYYTCNGEKIENIYTSMSACAEQGAYPCECVINYNE